MDGVPETVAGVARGLRPVGLWYAALTAVVGLLIWCYHGEKFDAWPTPFRCSVWLWLVVTVLVVPYLQVSALAAWAVEKISSRSAPTPHVASGAPPALGVAATGQSPPASAPPGVAVPSAASPGGSVAPAAGVKPPAA